MTVQYADIFPIVVTRPGSGGARAMRDIASVQVTLTMEKTPVHPMARDRLATGYTTGTIKVTWEMESSVPLAGLEIDWWEILRGKEECQADIEMGPGGARFQLVNFVVNEINPSTNAEGNAVARLRGIAIDYRPDKANAIGL